MGVINVGVLMGGSGSASGQDPSFPPARGSWESGFYFVDQRAVDPEGSGDVTPRPAEVAADWPAVSSKDG